jgi:hypothetical protein
VIDVELGDGCAPPLAAGFDRWDAGARRCAGRRRRRRRPAPVKDLFGKEDEDPLEGDDDFDVPSFLK